jgi:hypothetical protein
VPCLVCAWRNLQKGFDYTRKVHHPLLFVRAVPGNGMSSQGSRNLFGLHLCQFLRRRALVHALGLINTTKAHPLVEDDGIHLMHAFLLLEALDGELDAFDEGLVFVIQGLFLGSFRRRERSVDECVLETGRLHHILTHPWRVHLLGLWKRLAYNWYLHTWIVREAPIISVEVGVENVLSCQWNYPPDLLAISRDLKKSAPTQSRHDERTLLVDPHLLEAEDATDRNRIVLSAIAAFQKMLVCPEVLIGEIKLYLHGVSIG